MTINKFAIHDHSGSSLTSGLHIKAKRFGKSDRQQINSEGKVNFEKNCLWTRGIWFYFDGDIYLTHGLNQKPLTPASREWI
jgi:hypothetical protein